MDTFRSLVRRLLIASLLCGLSVIDLYPLLLAQNGRVVSVVSQGTERQCCCGTAEGRCCGMACCQASSPKKENVPVPSTSSDDRSQPLGLVAIPRIILAKNTEAVREGLCYDRANSGVSSLVAMSIRFNI